MITFCPYPVPVKTELGEGYVWYIESSGLFENDRYTVVLEDGSVRHFNTTQITVGDNSKIVESLTIWANTVLGTKGLTNW